MCLAEPGAAVDEERVVRLCRRLRHGERRRVGEPVRGPDHERVERVFRRHRGRSATAWRRARIGVAGRSGHGFEHGQPDRPLARDLTDRGADQVEEVTVDPVAREVVRDAEDELALGETRRPYLVEPGRVRLVVEGLPEPTRDVVPDSFRSQLDWLLHPDEALLAPPKRSASIATGRSGLNARIHRFFSLQKSLFCRCFFSGPHLFPHLWICVWTGDAESPSFRQQQHFRVTAPSHSTVEKWRGGPRLYWFRGDLARRIFFLSSHS